MDLRVFSQLLICVSLLLSSLLIKTSCFSQTANSAQALNQALQKYHENLRWKRFNAAAMFVALHKRADFINYFTAHEQDIHIDDIEIRALKFLPEAAKPAEARVALVTVLIQAYILPSTVLKRFTQIQRWEKNQEIWQIAGEDPQLMPLESRQPGLKPLPDHNQTTNELKRLTTS